MEDTHLDDDPEDSVMSEENKNSGDNELTAKNSFDEIGSPMHGSLDFSFLQHNDNLARKNKDLLKNIKTLSSSDDTSDATVIS